MDRFVFGPGAGHDQIADFNDRVDQILFRAIPGVSNLTEAMAHGRQIGADVVFDFGPADNLTVLNTTLSGLSDNILIT